MCNFFSLISDGNGTIYFFNSEQRKSKDSDYESYDSHTSIAHYFHLNEDKCNKYEFNPLTKKFVVDQINTEDDSVEVEKKTKKINFKLVVPELILKSIVHPFEIKRSKKITKQELQWLDEWVSVYSSGVWFSVRNSVRNSVWNSVWNSVRNSVRNSVQDSVRNSVWDSVWAYIGSFFDIWGSNYKYQSAVNLWENGLVPIFDGTTWRLHSKDGVVYEKKK